LENKDLRPKLPTTELPTAKDVRHVVPHAVDEEKVPPLEALLKYRHLAKAAP
jgi:hypothetical protein